MKMTLYAIVASLFASQALAASDYSGLLFCYKKLHHLTSGLRNYAQSTSTLIKPDGNLDPVDHAMPGDTTPLKGLTPVLCGSRKNSAGEQKGWYIFKPSDVFFLPDS